MAEIVLGLAPFPWEQIMWRVQIIDANLCLRRSSGLTRKTGANAEISTEQTEGGTRGSDKWVHLQNNLA